MATINPLQRKAMLIMSGTWKWTKPFLPWAEQLEKCGWCSEETDLDFPYVAWKCVVLRAAYMKYESRFEEPITVASLSIALGTRDGSNFLASFLSEVYDLLLIRCSGFGVRR
jgi:hypothetical protein